MKNFLIALGITGLVIIALITLAVHRRNNLASAFPPATTFVDVSGPNPVPTGIPVQPATQPSTSPTPQPAPQPTKSTTTSTPPKGASFNSGTYSESIVTADGRTRTYLLHIPTGYSTSKTYPLVFVFHGGLGTSQRILDTTQFVAKADANGFIVVAPDGISHTWNAGLGGKEEAPVANIDDVGFIRQLVEKLEGELPINKSRIYSTGDSAGGMISERLGCEASDIFAAIAPNVGPIPTAIYASCKPAHLISVVGIQGAADPLAQVDGITNGRLGGSIESALTTMQLWARIDHCNATANLIHQTPNVNDGTSVDEYTFTGCEAGTDVHYYIVQGMGHSWPPVPGAITKITGPTSHNINATDVYWAFFAGHPKQ